MAMIAPIIGLIGTAVSAFGTIAGAKAQSNALEYQAEAARRKGVQEVAVAQRKSLETKRKEEFAQSSLQAKASASGAGASDNTVVDLAGGLAKRGSYLSGLDLWQGKSNQWDFDVRAGALDAQADATRTAGNMSAFGTILGGASSFARSFGSQGGFTLPSAGTFDPSKEDDWMYRDRAFT